MDISPRVVNEVEFVWAQGTYHSSIDGGQFATSASVNSALTNNWAYHDPYGRVPAVSITGITGFSAGSRRGKNATSIAPTLITWRSLWASTHSGLASRFSRC